MKEKLFGVLYKKAGKIDKITVKTFMKRRLPIYLLIILVLSIWGVGTAVSMFFLVVSFFLGWTTNKIISAVKDYRLTLRLNRQHYSTLEYETMKKERDIALKAFEQISAGHAKKGVQGARQGNVPAMPSASPHMRSMDIDHIAEMMRQMGDDAK